MAVERDSKIPKNIVFAESGARSTGRGPRKYDLDMLTVYPEDVDVRTASDFILATGEKDVSNVLQAIRRERRDKGWQFKYERCRTVEGEPAVIIVRVEPKRGPGRPRKRPAGK